MDGASGPMGNPDGSGMSLSWLALALVLLVAGLAAVLAYVGLG